ncbi:MAG: hypothetical protein KC910_24455 [Candidatus Eremiobacteraeota bacterium]|nr:hypothetical protein [Candidatus Eremiobacteraeota bacterium]
MSWTRPADIRARLTKQWEQGKYLTALVTGEELFPLRLSLKKPTSAELASRFAEVQDWIGELARGDYRLEFKSVRHRVIGENQVPSAVWLDSTEQLAAFVRKGSELQRFGRLLEVTPGQLQPWLARRPLQALALFDEWPTLLRTVSWMVAHPRPGIYTRQLDLDGVHTKFLEQHARVLAELFELALPPEAIDFDQSRFEQRFGFRRRPPRIRLRFLGRPFAGLTDMTLTVEELATFEPDVSQVFVTENEVNFLAFPALDDSLVLLGGGYAIELFSQLPWLRGLPIYYWGDIDTHGFAILDGLRAAFPQTVSFLMDRATLLEHRSCWVTEPSPARRELPHLTPPEQALYQDLLDHHLGYSLRLEQELVGYHRVLGALRVLGFRPNLPGG